MTIKQTKKWHWKLNRNVYFMEELVTEDWTIADTFEKAFEILQNGYGKLEVTDVQLLSSTDVTLYGRLLEAMPTNDIFEEEIYEEEFLE